MSLVLGLRKDPPIWDTAAGSIYDAPTGSMIGTLLKAHSPLNLKIYSYEKIDGMLPIGTVINSDGSVTGYVFATPVPTWLTAEGTLATQEEKTSLSVSLTADADQGPTWVNHLTMADFENDLFDYKRYTLSIHDPAVTDTYTVLSLHFDGANGSSTFTEGTGKNAVVNVGLPALNTSTKKFGTASLYLDGSSSVKVVSNPAFELTEDFTIDFWTNFSTFPTSNGTNAVIMSNTDTSLYIAAQKNTTNTLDVGIGSSGQTSSGMTNNVVSLMHFDNNYTDEKNKTWSVSGNVSFSSTQKKFGLASLYFDGSNNTYITTPNTTDFNFGTGNFTVECWTYIDGASVNSWRSLFSLNGNFGDRGFEVLINQSYNGLNVANGTGYYQSFGQVPYDQWFHLAIERTSNTMTVYVNGAVLSTKTLDAGAAFGTSTSYSSLIGCERGNNYFFKGYIDELRITKGANAYGAAFTPYTQPFGTSSYIGRSYTFTPNISTWYHVAITRRDGVVKTFIDGTQVGTDWANTNTINANDIFIGSTYDNSSRYNGFIDDLRIVNGVSLYNANFTKPNTAHVITTIQNPGYVTTARAKYGTKSFRSTEISYVKTASRNEFHFAGDFTLEGWYYPLLTPDYGTFVSKWSDQDASYRSWWFGYEKTMPVHLKIKKQTGEIQYFVTQDTPSNNTWTHYAAVNYGGVISIYKGGSPLFVATEETGKKVIPYGSLSYGASSAYASSKSLAFNGTNTYINVTNGSESILNGDFTIEGFIKTSDTSIDATFGRRVMRSGAMGQWKGWHISINTDGRLQFQDRSNADDSIYQICNSNTTVADNTWKHFAIVRTNGKIHIYINGFRDDVEYNCTSVFSHTGITVGAYDVDKGRFNGNINGLRITKGVRYTGDTYTVPSAKFATTSDPQWSNVVFLMHGSEPTFTGAIASSSSAVGFGGFDNIGFDANIDNIRVMNIANYTASFTPSNFTLNAIKGYSVVRGQIPSGLVLDGRAGLLSGTFDDVYDATWTSATPTPVWTTEAGELGVVQESKTFTYTLTASARKGTAIKNWCVINGTLPVGLVLNGTTGVISGTAENIIDQVAPADYLTSLTPIPLWTTSGGLLDTVYENKSYSNTFTVVPRLGGAMSRYAVISGTLPLGISLNGSTGVISGTPEVVTLESIVDVDPDPTFVNTNTSLVLAPGEGCSLTFRATPSTGTSISNYFANGLLPRGLYLNASTGGLTGIVDSSNTTPTFNVPIRANQSNGGYKDYNFTINLDTTSGISWNYPQTTTICLNPAAEDYATTLVQLLHLNNNLQDGGGLTFTAMNGATFSNTTSKFGGYSLALNTNGENNQYITSNSSNKFDFGNGNFTIEGFVNFSTLSSSRIFRLLNDAIGLKYKFYTPNPSVSGSGVTLNTTTNTVTFAYSGAEQSMTFPANATLTITAKGAGGGGGGTGWGAGNTGGSGGYIRGTYNVTGGNVLKVIVGQGGVSQGTQMSFGGGGIGRDNNYNGVYQAANGGGYSGVFLGTVAHVNSIIIAGGGGGGGGGAGGAGGYPSGGNASSYYGSYGGWGGSQTGGGSAQNNYTGGAGGGYALGGGNSQYCGGGGGGGYYGGGGCDYGGGGGGSSFYSAAVTNVSHTTGGGGGGGAGNGTASGANGDITVQYLLTGGTGYISEFELSANNGQYVGTSATITPSIAVWNHFAVVKNGTNLALYWNGTKIINIDNVTDPIGSGATSIMYGLASVGNEVFRGYMDELRILKSAVYTTDFTPPTAAFADSNAVNVNFAKAISATSLPITYSLTGGTLPASLTFNSNGTITGLPSINDAGTYRLTITATDSANHTSSREFGLRLLADVPHHFYYMDVNAPLGYLGITGLEQGSSDTMNTYGTSNASLFLNAAINGIYKDNAYVTLNNGFTLEGVAKFTSFTQNQTIIGVVDTASTNGVAGVYIQALSNSKVRFGTYNGTSWVTYFDTIGTISTNTWYHFTLVRNNGVMKGYINGMEIGSISFTGTPTVNRIYMGTNLRGNLDRIKFFYDKAQYTAPFTPPTY